MADIRQPPNLPKISQMGWEQSRAILENYLKQIGRDAYQSTTNLQKTVVTNASTNTSGNGKTFAFFVGM